VRLVPRASGHLARFGAPRVALDVPVDLELAQALVRAARADGFRVSPCDDRGLDHGTMVPLWLLPRTRAGKRFVFIGICGWSRARLLAFGEWLHGFLADRSAILIASGDLSHRLTEAAPYGFRPQGRVFDERVIEALRSSEWEDIASLDADSVEAAGECGLRPLTILLGAARAAGLRSEVLSYEGPFGVGYPVATFNATTPDYDVAALARSAIAGYLERRETIAPPEPIPAALRAPSAVFVTLRRDGVLRGCVGTIRPTRATAAHEIVHYAIASAVRDPRFEPVEPAEVSMLSVHVHLLDAPEPVEGTDALDPARYGLIVRSGDRQGLLLPNVDGIRTAAEQLAAALEKAGIDADASIELLRFRTRTFG
ncbi:MAG TPA: AmmeMemoRadiSam system protein A, partial [Candidatus Limnocylindrales bacterium]|nr:AmmeMemoRadiSam system protein A [Candidatus Limnocylindrales bacterium]